jgi:small subunit ribosomal protein S21
MHVSVHDNNVDQALRALKKKLQREGVFREMKLKEHFEKPSVRKVRKKAEGIRHNGSFCLVQNLPSKKWAQNEAIPIL